MLSSWCSQSEGRGPDMEKHAIARYIWLSILRASCFLIIQCGPRPGTIQDPEEPVFNVPLTSTQDGCINESVDEDDCPFPDKDGDRIPDKEDMCPFLPEIYNGEQDDDGCPDPDMDGDRIPDDEDMCPDSPETYNGKEDEDGCPDGCDMGANSTVNIVSLVAYFDQGIVTARGHPDGWHAMDGPAEGWTIHAIGP